VANLVKLNLSNNYLGGEVPTEITNLEIPDDIGLELQDNCSLHSDDTGTQGFIVKKSAVANYDPEFLATQGNCPPDPDSNPVMAPIIMYLLN